MSGAIMRVGVIIACILIVYACSDDGNGDTVTPGDVEDPAAWTEKSVKDLLRGQWYSDQLHTNAFNVETLYCFDEDHFFAKISDLSGVFGDLGFDLGGRFTLQEIDGATGDLRAAITFDIEYVVARVQEGRIECESEPNPVYCNMYQGSYTDAIRITEEGFYMTHVLVNPSDYDVDSNENALVTQLDEPDSNIESCNLSRNN